MKFLKQLLPDNAFVRAVGVLVAGTAGAQILTLAASPLLTRLYKPEDFGLLAVFASLLSLLGILSSLRYELAIPLPSEDQESVNIIGLSLLILILFTILVSAVLFVWGDSIAGYLGVPKMAGYLWLLPLGVFLQGCYSIFSYWNLRIKRFSTIAGTKLNQAVAALVVQLAVFRLGFVALLLAQVVGQSVGVLRLASSIVRRPEIRQVRGEDFRSLAIKYIQFPKFNVGASLINTLGQYLPIFVLSAVFSASFTGLYALAHRILAVPFSLLGGAISNVYLAEASAAHRDGSLGVLTTRVHNVLVQIALPPSLFLIFIAPDLFEFVFGADWKESGHLARWIIPWIYIELCTAPFQVFVITGRQKLAFYLQIVMFCLKLSGILVGVNFGDFQSVIIGFSVGSFLGYVMMLYAKLRVSDSDILSAAKSHISAFFVGAACISPILLISALPEANGLAIAAYVLATLFLGLRLYFITRSGIRAS